MFYIGNPSNIKVFRSNKTKGLKQDSPNRLRSPMLVREENQSFDNNYIIYEL